MKSYGRAPTFLITTGNEQVRSIVAHLAGDDTAADEVQLVLPETGVCSSSNALSDEEVNAGVQAAAGCCDSSPAVPAPEQGVSASLERLRVGFATGVPNGRAGYTGSSLQVASAALRDVPSRPAGGCRG